MWIQSAILTSSACLAASSLAGAVGADGPASSSLLVQDEDAPKPRVKRGEEIERPRRQGEDRRGKTGETPQRDRDGQADEGADGDAGEGGKAGRGGVPKNARAVANRMAADIKAHRQRVARIERLTELFQGKGKEEQLARTQRVAEREQAAFANRMERYRGELGEETYESVLHRLRQAPPKKRGRGERGDGPPGPGDSRGQGKGEPPGKGKSDARGQGKGDGHDQDDERGRSGEDQDGEHADGEDSVGKERGGGPEGKGRAKKKDARAKDTRGGSQEKTR